MPGVCCWAEDGEDEACARFVLDVGRSAVRVAAVNMAPFALIPDNVLGLLKEIFRHLIRRPVVGICTLARNAEGQILLVRRGDTGTWALPGGTLEWGETFQSALPREVEEETGATVTAVGRVTGIYSRPDRDVRFHAVTVCVETTVEGPLGGAKNSLEIRDVRFFDEADIPYPLAMGLDDLLKDALAKKPEAVLE